MSAISFTCEMTGSWATMSKKAANESKPPSYRPRVGARSKRKPSKPISVTQYRSESVIMRSATGCPVLTELPHPVASK